MRLKFEKFRALWIFPGLCTKGTKNEFPIVGSTGFFLVAKNPIEDHCAKFQLLWNFVQESIPLVIKEMS